MSDYHYGPALTIELDYRREALVREAADHRLARQAGAAARAARRRVHH